MIDIPLQPIANQELSIPLDGSRFVITVKEANGSMVATVVRDNVTIIQNARMLADDFVLPYTYLRNELGNFFFATQGEALADWQEFGRTQFLVYATADEIAAA